MNIWIVMLLLSTALRQSLAFTANSFAKKPARIKYFAADRLILFATLSTQSATHLVIVESPSKCSTIEKILQEYVKQQQLDINYQVTSCYGHVRNLPKKGGGSKSDTDKGDFPYAIAGIDLVNNYEPSYEIIPGKEKIVRELQRLSDEADKVILATDPDREGEAMAWHLTQILSPNKDYQRVTFSEITPSAVVHAVNNPVQLNTHLVQAQETRRILDRLAGYTVSPILWKKIAPGLSAGRVQSVGMALVVQRERERLLFEPTPYCDLSARFSPPFEADLHAVNGTLVANSGADFTSQGQALVNKKKMHLKLDSAQELTNNLRDGTWTVVQVKSTRRQQQAPMPYKTSTLQQDSNRRLGMSVQQTMRTAQQLYENGLISYMRTDSTQLSEDAIATISNVVQERFQLTATHGPVKKKSKRDKDSNFAQEAHEAIRPAIQDGTFVPPEQLTGISSQAKGLYELIYKRTLACCMPPLVTNLTQIVVEGVKGETTAHFRASGSVVISPGYTLAYGHQESDAEPILPVLEEGQDLSLKELTVNEHTSQAPPRYNEASFVKELEDLGVGRPSTYAGIVQILRERVYVGNPLKGDNSPRRQKQVSGSAISAQRAAGGEEFTGGGAQGPLVPSLSAFVVCSLLEKHCPTYVDPGFTSAMEERLDLIASGEMDSQSQRVSYLNEFYAGSEGLAAKIKRIEDQVDPNEARRAVLPAIEQEGSEIGIFVGPWGPYVQKIHSNDEKPASAPLPSGMAGDVSKITPQILTAVLSAKEEGGILLGQHPDDGRNIRLKTGRFGAYLQWGDDGEEGSSTHSLPRKIAVMRDFSNAIATDDDNRSLSSMLGLSLEEAVGYISLPREVSTLHDLPISAAIGPYGPYLKYNSTFLSLKERDGDVLTIDADTAERLVQEGIIDSKQKSNGSLAELGEKDGYMVTVKNGRFGPYISWRRVNAKLPAQYFDDPSSLPLDEAWDLIQEKSGTITRVSGRTKKSGPQVELPPSPKRPLSAYLYFCADKRPEVSKTVSSLGEVSKKLALLWSETTAEGRVVYEKKAADDKAQYEEKKATWQEECKRILGSTSSSKKVAKPASSKLNVKKPLSAYFHFCQEMRPEVSVRMKTLGDISKELARLWKETEDRSKYENLAAEDKKRFEAEMVSFSLEGEIANFDTPKEKSSTSLNKGTPRPPSAYMLFCREYRASVKDENGEKLSLGETTKVLATMWKDADKSTRAKFDKLAREGKENLLTTQ